MKSYVCIVLIVFLGIVAVQGYGPKINRRKIESPPKPSPRFSGSRRGPPWKPPGYPQHWSKPPNQHKPWDNSPEWNDRSSDNGDYSGDRGDSGDSGDRYDSYGNSPEDISPSRDDSYYDTSSYEDSGWHGHHPSHHNVKPKPKPKPKPTPTTRKPKTTSRPRPRPTRPPHPHTTTETTTRATSKIVPIPETPTTPSSKPTWHPTPFTEDTTHWETTTSSVSETTIFLPVTTGSDIESTTGQDGDEFAFTTISPEIQQCIDTCISTPEYNPVCGSNGQTFDNEGKLFCAARCGVNVTLRRRSVCPPPNWDIFETPGTRSTPAPTTDTTPYVGRTTPLTSYQRCMKQCAITGSYSPVCGTDLITYMNMDRLKCAQSCGEVVHVLCEKPCPACNFNPGTLRTTTTSQTTSTSSVGRTTPTPDVKECMNTCPLTSENNPVCGSNQVTYTNPSRMVCAQMCGIDVAIIRFGSCDSTTTSTTTTAGPRPRTTRSPAALACIRSCPVTSEYNPVCGTDGLTYTNPGNLECAKFCGIYVELKHKSRCIDEFNLDGDSTTAQTTSSINESKDTFKTTESSTPLFTSPSITTEKPTTPSTKSTSTKNPGPKATSTLGFTIPDDVLKNIFGSTDKPTITDEDEDLDLDVRFSPTKATDTDKEKSEGH